MPRPALSLSLLAALAGGAFLAPVLSADAPTYDGDLSDNPRAQLGRQLFFDPILSRDRTVSCASCHQPARAFADDRALSLGVDGRLGTRNTPSVMNSAGRTRFFWDGRSETLEEQALAPIANPLEMDLPVDDAVARLRADPAWVARFQDAYSAAPSARTLGRALAAYQKTLNTVDSPYDRYALGQEDAISDAAKRGRLLFITKAQCVSCHAGEDFTSDRFKNIGIYNGREFNDEGRGGITGDPAQKGEFKVPGLRNVALTAPYMHNGMFKSLREVIVYYDDPGKVIPDSIGRDAQLRDPLHLSEAEIDDIEQFLHTLTDDRFASRATSSTASPP